MWLLFCATPQQQPPAVAVVFVVVPCCAPCPDYCHNNKRRQSSSIRPLFFSSSLGPPSPAPQSLSIQSTFDALLCVTRRRIRKTSEFICVAGRRTRDVRVAIMHRRRIPATLLLRRISLSRVSFIGCQLMQSQPHPKTNDCEHRIFIIIIIFFFKRPRSRQRRRQPGLVSLESLLLLLLQCRRRSCPTRDVITWF